MTRTLPTRSALVVVFLLLAAVVLPVSARSDGSARLQMLWPADGIVTSPFGEWRGSRRHEGVDIGMLRSLEVRAAAPGVVREIGYSDGYEGYGKVIVVDLAGPYQVIYAHLAGVEVRLGQRVRRGQPIGVAGCTGSCSGTHLHFEVQDGGVPVNPMRFLG
jgi:murein DD-endopeptidase MepM/ murein hydrolase activator NlpD